MVEFIFIGVVAFIASILTFFSGFGLGTILLPALAIFFPIEVAIALTGIVHLLNNLFKMTLVGKNTDWKVAWKFGIPGIIGALIGAFVLIGISEFDQTINYILFGVLQETSWIKIVIAFLMVAFAILELIPSFNNLNLSGNRLFIGGAISGFFGGLSGHQGALRSAFLIKANLSKSAFIATGVMIASFIDISRIAVYFTRFSEIGFIENFPILSTAVLAAFGGAVIGKYLLKKVTIHFIQLAISIMILVLGIALGLGLI